MIDKRLETFLVLCQTKNYTETANLLHITQPAVTQHIKYLEEFYKVQLIKMNGKHFALTKEGRLLQHYAKTLNANSELFSRQLNQLKHQKKMLTFGATLTIGEYTMPPIINKLLIKQPSLNVSMFVENTKILQQMLLDGKIDFALIEGQFDQEQFNYQVIAQKKYIAVCSSSNPLSKGSHNYQDLLVNNLIIRENGSGTRDILEKSLAIYNYSINDFNTIHTIGNMNAIKKMCQDNIGITFLYQEAVQNELANNYLKEIKINYFEITHPFYFVYLKNNIEEEKLLKYFNFLKLELLDKP